MNAFRTGYRRAALATKRAILTKPSKDTIADVEERDAAMRALATLSPRQRAAVVLTDLLDFSYEDAAQMLGVRASTVRVHVLRAHAALKGSMQHD
jgi:RNA polymerase sigma factor (sigma-70 family)